MTPCSMAFTVGGEPHFDDPAETHPDFGKKLEALASKQGLRFGMAGLYPPSEFPGYDHPHFEYCLFTGKTASSDFTSIDFDYYPKREKLLVRSDLPKAQVLPIAKFIAKNYLCVTLEREPNWLIRYLVVRDIAPPSRQFCDACRKLADLIGECRESVDLNIQRYPSVRKRLDQMAQCMQEFNHDDVERMAGYACDKLHKSLKAWIEKCHPDSSFSRLVLKLTEPLHTKQDWIDALFIRLEGPRWSYKPKLFAELRDDCEKNDNDSEGNAKLLNEQTAELKAHVTNEADRVIAAKAPKRKKKSGHEGNGLKGPKTTMMKKQREVFNKYLLDHPESSENSRNTNAHLCWLAHREWEKAANAQGDAKGYQSYKSLAAAK